MSQKSLYYSSSKSQSSASALRKSPLLLSGERASNSDVSSNLEQGSDDRSLHAVKSPNLAFEADALTRATQRDVSGKIELYSPSKRSPNGPVFHQFWLRIRSCGA